MKKINDYLHLYLDAPMLAIPQHDTSRQYVECRIKTIHSIGTEIEMQDLSELTWYSFISDIKLILRPLSDMTEGEVVELIKKLSHLDLSDCQFDITEDEDSFYINAEKEGRVIDSLYMQLDSDVVTMMNSEGDFHPVNPQADAFHFFLSKHFDLFNLIEAGLAIDATLQNAKPSDTTMQNIAKKAD